MQLWNTAAVVAMAVTGLGAAGPVGPTEPTQHATPHVRLVSYASSAEIAPGRPNSLVVEVTPARSVRVYAPGQLDYRPVSLALEPNAHVTARPAVLPKPVEHVFAATGDRSLVYDRPFRLELPLTLARTPAGSPRPETLDLKATFEYQACDDSVCYRPTKVALRYSLRVAQ